jgi:hypothetical protein
MEASGWALIAASLAALLAWGAEPSDLFEIDVRKLAAVWENEHTSLADPRALKHIELRRRVDAIEREFSGFIRREQAGASVEGRAIERVTVGSGPKRILLWSQMHGDEATATSAILDLLRFFGVHRGEPWVDRILRAYTLDFVPMLNPDGAERNQRRNAQGIDINRDARALQTPEGRLLQGLRDRLQPFLGFNLHNQNSATTVGDTGEVATIALLAVAADQAQSAGASRILAKQVTAVLYEALSPFVYGHISRYDEDFNPRAFGDNLTLAGTPIVLIESGGAPAGAPPGLGVKLNFVGILAVLDSLASGRIAAANPAVFDAMKRNSDTPIFDLLLRNAWIYAGNDVPLFRGDVAIRRDSRAGSDESIIADVGDLGVFSAHRTIDCSGMLLTPGLIAWAPERMVSNAGGGDAGLLRRGVTTVLETAQAGAAPQAPEPRRRVVHWGFVLAGDARPTAEDRLRIAAWLAAGARSWIADHTETDDAQVARWFGVDRIARPEALRFVLPQTLEGGPARVLGRHTSEAARRFHVPRRGVIAPGFAADLMLWTTVGDGPPADIGRCHPARAVLDGVVIDLSAAELPAAGRFLGR